MTYTNLLTTTENGIFTLVINRPDKLNALNRQTVQEIGAAINRAMADKNVYGIILTGSGTKAFVAGADISEFVGLSPEQGMAMAQAGQDVFKSIENCPKPVIAAVNGFALGGGCELAMACHVRIAAENAVFGQPEVKLGLIPGYGGTQRLTQLVGKGKSMEYTLSAENIKAPEALAMGLVNYVVPQDQLLARAMELMLSFRRWSPHAQAGVIASVNACLTNGTNGFNTEVIEFGKCFGTDDFKEGVNAFLEKRKPKFS
ncbi:MAG: enoyl-CoA hydratase/isomerase family protein [Bacteroidia bacterium]|nr:enoyl-CoA hydratase/isomerase family protein [Bacteroidia bacterium]